MSHRKSAAKMEFGSSSRSAHLPDNRWKPTAAHLRILETFHEGLRGHVATPEQVYHLHGKLLPYGDVEARSVFYWLSNRRVRDKEKKRSFPDVPATALPGPFFYAPAGTFPLFSYPGEIFPGRHSKRNKVPTLVFSRDENRLIIASDQDERIVSVEPPSPFPLPENKDALPTSSKISSTGDEDRSGAPTVPLPPQDEGEDPFLSLELSLKLPSGNVGVDLSVLKVPLLPQEEDPPLSLELSLKPYNPEKPK